MAVGINTMEAASAGILPLGAEGPPLADQDAVISAFNPDAGQEMGAAANRLSRITHAARVGGALVLTTVAAALTPTLAANANTRARAASDTTVAAASTSTSSQRAVQMFNTDPMRTTPWAADTGTNAGINYFYDCNESGSTKLARVLKWNFLSKESNSSVRLSYDSLPGIYCDELGKSTQTITAEIDKPGPGGFKPAGTIVRHTDGDREQVGLYLEKIEPSYDSRQKGVIKSLGSICKGVTAKLTRMRLKTVSRYTYNDEQNFMHTDIARGLDPKVNGSQDATVLDYTAPRKICK